MKVVFKYDVPERYGLISIDMHMLQGGSANILCLGLQNDLPVIWAEVDNKEMYVQLFELVATGQKLADLNEWLTREYVGTVQQNDGFVMHLFKIIKITTL